jgi:hypothetical protein
MYIIPLFSGFLIFFILALTSLRTVDHSFLSCALIPYLFIPKTCVWTRVLPNTKQVCQPLGHDVSYPEMFVFCDLLTTLYQQLRIYGVEWKNGRWILNWKGCGKKRSWLILRCYPGICLKDMTKITKKSVVISGLLAEIWTPDLPNTNTTRPLFLFLNWNRNSCLGVSGNRAWLETYMSEICSNCEWY